MVTNAVVHLQTHPEQVRKYSEKVIASQNELKSRTQLYTLLRNGPGKLYKRPASLAFIADGGDAFLPNESVNGHGWTLYGTTSLWSLGYPRLNMNTISTLRPNAMAIDWVFIITYLLSFIPFLFTFDAISGERERGTLRLCFANSISRSALLVGKFPWVPSSLFSSPSISQCYSILPSFLPRVGRSLVAADWGRLGLIVLIASCYTGIFTAVGTYRLRNDTRKSVKPCYAPVNLGDLCRVYTFNTRHSLIKMDAPCSKPLSV